MRKLYLSVASCVALVAFMGFSVSALAAPDPSCDGTPYNNDPAVHDFTITMTDSNVSGEVSGLSGSGLACGADTQNSGSYYDHADIGTPPGVVINNTSGMANGRFVGTALVNVMVADIFGGVYEDVHSELSIAPIAECAAENPVGGDIPGTIIACYRGDNPVGYNYNWGTVDNDGKSWLTIGPFHSFVTSGLTHIKEFNLCGYVGASGGSSCGTSSDPFLQKNGDASQGGLVSIRKPGGIKSAPPIGVRYRPDCFKGTGTYSVTATKKGWPDD